jgi:hypothetical protein
MANQEYDINVELPIDVLVIKLLNHPQFTGALAEIIRTNILQNARAYGTALGGYAGQASPQLQNIAASPVYTGHWQTINGKQYWIHN